MADRQPPHILVVDDNIMSRAVIERRLTRDGYGVFIANSGAEALSVVNREPIDLIFLDLVMDGISGMEVLATLKSDEEHRDIPVVIISGTDDAGAVAEAKAAGASDFLRKPVIAATLQETVSNILRSGSLAGSNGSSTIAADAGLSAEEAAVINPAGIEQLIRDYGKQTTVEFIDTFEGMAPDLRDAITDARATGDADNWHRAAHDLKGSARALGLVRLAAICRDIEIACDEGRLDDADRSTDELNEHFDEALKEPRVCAAGYG